MKNLAYLSRDDQMWREHYGQVIRSHLVDGFQRNFVEQIQDEFQEPGILRWEQVVEQLQAFDQLSFVFHFCK